MAVPDPGIAAHVSLIKLPKDRLFVVEMMQWEDPVTTRKTVVGTPAVSIAVVVHNVDSILDQMIHKNDNMNEESLWRLSSGPIPVLLPPPIGSATSATILDPNGMPVELVSYIP